MRPTRALFHFGLLLLAACGGTQSPSSVSGGVHPWTSPRERDGQEDPAQLRPKYGNTDLHFWWPLTDPEIAALKGVDKAKSGDAQALLALAVFAAGDHRDTESYRGYQQRVEKFVADVRPAIERAPDDWHRAYELHRAMHRAFFTGERGELGTYELTQARVTGIFDRGHYNCISSAMLFAVLARYFAIPVRGVTVPTHAFIEVGPPNGKVLEVETTSDTGFDLVHDQRFYKEAAAKWSSSRGLRPVTLEEYQHREILEPYRLMAADMDNQYTTSKMPEEDRARLREAAAFVDAAGVDAQRRRMQIYANEANELRERKAARTLVKMYDCVRGAVAESASKWPKDATLQRAVWWSGWFFADALEVVGRGEEALAITDEALDRIDLAWEDGPTLRGNYLIVFTDQMLEQMKRKDFAAAVKVVSKHLDACRGDALCASNLEVVYGNWSIEHQKVGDWQAARQVLQDCVSQLPSSSSCGEAMKDLESRHRF